MGAKNRRWGFSYEPRKTQRDRLDIPVIVVGRFYSPSDCNCGLPAWELCEPNCKHGLPGAWDPLEDAKRFNKDFR